MSEKGSPWPLGWHAPGDYLCTCHRCGGQFQGDKRSHECLACAIILAKGKIKAYEDAMRFFRERSETLPLSGLQYRGRPIEDMSRDELIAALVVSAQLLKKAYESRSSTQENENE